MTVNVQYESHTLAVGADDPYDFFPAVHIRFGAAFAFQRRRQSGFGLRGVADCDVLPPRFQIGALSAVSPSLVINSLV